VHDVLGSTQARTPVVVSHSPERVPRPHSPHSVVKGSVQLSVVNMQLDHVQSFMHSCWPLPTSVEQSTRSSGRHTDVCGSTHARTPVIGSHAPERTPQFPHGVVVGSKQFWAVITHSDHRQLLLHVCLPLPAAVEQSMVL
jgi:hypothetical protein